MPAHTSPIKLLHRVAQGSSGDVFLCAGGGSKSLALKRLHERSARNATARERLLREAQIGASLQHFNLVQVFGPRAYAGCPGLLMEYVEGFSVAQLLSLEGSLPLEAALSVTRQLVAALNYLHTNAHTEGPIVHGDVKPANVLIAQSGRVKLADLGACLLPGEAQLPALRGTLRYMAPEQARGEGMSTHSDQFAVGLILGEMLLGRPLYTDASTVALIEKVRAGALDAVLSNIGDSHPSVLPFLKRLLQSQPEDRFQNMDSVEDALLALEGEPQEGDFSLKGLVLDADLKDRRGKRSSHHQLGERWAKGPMRDWHIYEWASGELAEQADRVDALELDTFLDEEAEALDLPGDFSPEHNPVQPPMVGRKFPSLLRSFRGATLRSESSNFLNRIRTSLGTAPSIPSRR